MKLHNYYRSGTSQRVRIALELKGLDYEYVPVNLLTGQHRSEEFGRLQPQHLAPALEVDGHTLIQSPAIIEWLEETYPAPALLPQSAADRAKVRSMSMIIGCDIHPLNNLRVLNAVKTLRDNPEPPTEWISHWVQSGFSALERMLQADRDRNPDFCFGNEPTMVECYLVPQVYGARRFGVDLTAFPAICRIDEACAALPAFQRAAPENQPDCPPS